MSRREALATPVKTSFDRGDLEKVAEKTFSLIWENTEVEGMVWTNGYGKSRVLLEAVQAIAGY